MKHINTLIIAATLSTPLGAEPVFPPPHLAEGASFPTGHAVPSMQPPRWYFRAETAHRAHLAEREQPQVSPWPAAYYVARIRGYANDTQAEVAAIRAVHAATATIAERD